MKEQIVRNLLWLLSTMTICSCSKGVLIDRHIEVDSDSIKVSCTLQRITPFGLDTSSVVHAELTINNKTNRVLVFNLHELSLIFPNRKSSGPYIDSFADVLIKDEILKESEFVRHKVYWAIKPPVSASEIEQAALTISP
jgi:hypothetical protein